MCSTGWEEGDEDVPYCPLSRERPAPAQRAGRMPTPQRARRPRYENRAALCFANLERSFRELPTPDCQAPTAYCLLPT